jgi:hypothetical protein
VSTTPPIGIEPRQIAARIASHDRSSIRKTIVSSPISSVIFGVAYHRSQPIGLCTLSALVSYTAITIGMRPKQYIEEKGEKVIV